MDDSSFHILVTGIGAIPGIGGLVMAAVGYGRLSQKVRDMEKDLGRVASLSNQVSILSNQVARVETSTISIQAQLPEIKASVDRLVDRMLDGISDRSRARPRQ